MWDYTDKVREHYLHPRNVGEIEHPDGFGEVGNIKCGDALRLTFKVDESGKITDIKFKTFGCGSAIASSSILTEMCKGKTLEEVKQITNKDIAQALDGLPQEKMHCSVMGQEALSKAIEYYANGGKVAPQAAKHGHAVCICFNVTDTEIEQVIRENNLKTVEEVTHFTKAGGGCGGCIPQIEEILGKVNGEPKKQSPIPPRTMTLLQKIDSIRQVLDTEIRPLLRKDGGDCEFIDIQGNTVIIRFSGHCKGCEMIQVTQFEFIEKILRQKVLPELVVQQG